MTEFEEELLRKNDQLLKELKSVNERDTKSYNEKKTAEAMKFSNGIREVIGLCIIMYILLAIFMSAFTRCNNQENSSYEFQKNYNSTVSQNVQKYALVTTNPTTNQELRYELKSYSADEFVGIDPVTKKELVFKVFIDPGTGCFLLTHPLTGKHLLYRTDKVISYKN